MQPVDLQAQLGLCRPDQTPQEIGPSAGQALLFALGRFALPEKPRPVKVPRQFSPAHTTPLPFRPQPVPLLTRVDASPDSFRWSCAVRDGPELSSGTADTLRGASEAAEAWLAERARLTAIEQGPPPPAPDDYLRDEPAPGPTQPAKEAPQTAPAQDAPERVPNPKWESTAPIDPPLTSEPLAAAVERELRRSGLAYSAPDERMARIVGAGTGPRPDFAVYCDHSAYWLLWCGPRTPQAKSAMEHWLKIFGPEYQAAYATRRKSGILYQTAEGLLLSLTGCR